MQNKAHYFRHILAVTFANKATQEMKDRILDYLGRFAKGEEDDLSAELISELKQDKDTFIQNCTELRSEILHHYDLFSISTIDAFFQKVIRSFTRESGLIGDFRLEVDDEGVLEEVINNLIDELGEKPDLTQWVVEFAKENLENDRAWDVRSSLMDFAKEITFEQFKAIEDQIQTDTADPEFFRKLRSELWKVKNSFLNAVSKPAAEVLQVINSKGWEDSDFTYQQNSGLRTFLNLFSGSRSISDLKEIKDRIRFHYTFSKNWPHKTSRHSVEIMQNAEKHFIPNFKQIISYYDKHFEEALSAEVVLQNMYVFGLISDISRKLKDYKSENNLMLLSDAPKFLNGIIRQSDTPFIYEKIGSFYRHYLIDEFQDTSGFQWQNFLPLLTNGLDQGYRSLVVGDVKQAIYRWRGGDLKLLQQKVEEYIGKNRVEVKELARNFRSSTNIIQFNNALFTSLSALIASKTNSQLPASAYQDIVQEISKRDEGFVHISFLEKDDEETSWEDQALKNIPHQLETLQRRGVAIRDIAILVRRNSEGQRIADYLLQYKNSSQSLADCKYEVVSNESLRMNGAASVNLLLAALRYLLNPEDAIARAQLSFEYARLHKPKRSQTEVFAVANQVFFERQLPDQFTKEKMSLKKLPLFELTETLVSLLKLGKEQGELPYLLAFQDLVLEFYSRERNDIGAFLEWWEDNKTKEKTSIKISGEVDAIKILTIHKSKGLQFKYVLIPFCSWDMDHKFLAPNLWVKSDAIQFAAAGYLPVKYSSSLDKTYFQNYYQEEKTATYLDNLNLLYVALTRAEEGMIITAPTKQNGTVAEWLLTGVSGNEELKSMWNDASQEFVMGDWHQASPDEKKNISNTIPLHEYYSSRWRDNLVIRQTGTTFFEEKQTDQRVKINYGIHLHAVLSRIRHTDEIPQSVERLVQEGMISEQEKSGIRDQLDKLMSHPVVGGWFAPEWQVKTEVPILLPGGAENRIDRLMIRDGKAIVVDFKTGDKTKADQKQVIAYMDILRKMNFKTVEGYLLYTRDQEVISLNDGKQKVVKKKNDQNQLGFGFLES